MYMLIFHGILHQQYPTWACLNIWDQYHQSHFHGHSADSTWIYIGYLVVLLRQWFWYDSIYVQFVLWRQFVQLRREANLLVTGDGSWRGAKLKMFNLHWEGWLAIEIRKEYWPVVRRGWCWVLSAECFRWSKVEEPEIPQLLDMSFFRVANCDWLDRSGVVEDTFTRFQVSGATAMFPAYFLRFHCCFALEIQRKHSLTHQK